MKEKDKRRDARGESRERAKCQRETLGKYFYDLSKLTFTALVLGGIAMLFQSEKIEISMIGMFMVGILFSVGLAFCGNKIYESIDISFRGNAIDTCGVYRLDVHAIRQALVG